MYTAVQNLLDGLAAAKAFANPQLASVFARPGMAKVLANPQVRNAFSEAG